VTAPDAAGIAAGLASSESALAFCYALLAPGQDANRIIAANPEQAKAAHRAIYERHERVEPYDDMMARTRGEL
jgi:hypothetical protein